MLVYNWIQNSEISMVILGTFETMGTNEVILAFVIGFILLLPIALMIMIVYLLLRRNKSQAGLQKQCPFCAENINVEAKVCRYCHRDLV
jgi:hypothetical protein